MKNSKHYIVNHSWTIEVLFASPVFFFLDTQYMDLMVTDLLFYIETMSLQPETNVGKSNLISLLRVYPSQYSCT